MSKIKRKGLHLNSSLTANAVITNKQIYGANHIVVEGAGSIICDTVMNYIYYLTEEVVALAARTNGDIHAPSGHPEDEKGNFISAGHPMATQQNFIGGVCNNYRINGDRLVRDIAINPEIANRSTDGKEIIRRIDNNEDTDTSTGLLLSLEESEGIGKDGEPYKWIARNMELDHDAILLNERGAATSLQGVGMFANAKGDEFLVDEYTINASLPAMNLPLAPGDYVWNETEALARIKTFTNSTDKPSSNFRRFFFNFDQSKVESFDSYKNLFADIIDGVPHAVKSPVESVINNENAKKYNERFTGNSSGFINKTWEVIKSSFMGNRDLSHDEIDDKIHKKLNEGRSDNMRHLWPFRTFDTKFVYRSDNDTMLMQSFALVDGNIVFIGQPVEVEHVEDFIPVTNNKDGDSVMRTKILTALNAAKVKTEGLDDDALLAAYNKLGESQGGGNESQNDDLKTDGVMTLLDITKAVNAAVKPLQDQINANTEKELEEVAKKVGELDIGITEEAAKIMGVNACKSVLAKNGFTAFNSSGGYQNQHQNNSEALTSIDMPMAKEG